MHSYQYRNSHCLTKMIFWPSDPHNGIFCTCKTFSYIELRPRSVHIWQELLYVWFYQLKPWLNVPGPRLNTDTVFSRIWIPILKVKRLWDRFIFIMRMPIQVGDIIILRRPPPPLLVWVTPNKVLPQQYVHHMCFVVFCTGWQWNRF